MQAENEALVFEPQDAGHLVLILGRYASVSAPDERGELEGVLSRAIDFNILQLNRSVQGDAFDFGEFSARHERILERPTSLKPEESERLSFPGPPEVLRRAINWAAINLGGEDPSVQTAESIDRKHTETSEIPGESGSGNEELGSYRSRALVAAGRMAGRWAVEMMSKQI